MRVGTLTVVLYLPDANSLKDKRQVVKSLIDIIRRKFNVSIAEVADLDKWRRATIGVACVANDGRFIQQVLDKVVDTLESIPTIDVAEVEMELS